MLRPYQENARLQIRDHFLRGKRRVLLVMPTGAGKTVVFCDMVKRAVDNGKRAGIVVRGRKLVDQASARLMREEVRHGVLMASHHNHRPHLPVQVYSIDTLRARDLVPEFDLLIVDEAHLFTSKGDREFLARLQAKGFTVAVTATPYCPGGLRHLAEEMVRPVTMQELIDQGHLVPFRYFAPSEPDLRGVRINSVTKDYNTTQLEERMVAGQLTGRIIDHWAKIASDLPTLLFAVNINHSKMLVERFRAAGIAAEHCDADSPDSERANVIRRLETGRTKVVCNVGIFCTGVDIPALGALIMARSTASRNLYIQQAGRGTRPHPGKRDCILLDHAGNIRRHGFPTFEPQVDLDGREKSDSYKPEAKICKECFAVYLGPVCTECGVEPPKRERPEIAETHEELQEIRVTAKSPAEQWLEYLEQQRAKTGRKNGWQYWKLLDKFPREEVEHLLPPWFKHRIKMKESQEASIFAGSPFQGFGGE